MNNQEIANAFIQIAGFVGESTEDYRENLPDEFGVELEETDMLKLLNSLFPFAHVYNRNGGAYGVSLNPPDLGNDFIPGDDITVLEGAEVANADGKTNTANGDGTVTYRI